LLTESARRVFIKQKASASIQKNTIQTLNIEQNKTQSEHSVFSRHHVLAIYINTN